MLTFGNGEVLFDGSSKAFQLKYTGTITITESPDNLFLTANKTKIIGIMLDGTDLPSKLFNYIGELKVLSCKSEQNNSMQREKISLQGVDYWELDSQKWEDDDSLWGTKGGTYLVGSRQRFNRHSIVVNNNIKTQADGQYKYKDGSPVPANTLIHIHADGIAMTGGVHTDDSVEIYPERVLTKTQVKLATQQITQATSISGSGGY